MALASARPAQGRLSLEHLRARATELYAALVWLHVPIVAGIALITDHAWVAPTATLATVALIATACIRYMHDGAALRSIVALALVAGPIAFGWATFGSWSLGDTYLYFYAVVAMLVGYVDWRPIIVAASAATFSAVLLSLAASDILFPAEGFDRLVIQGICLIAECFVLINITGILQRLPSIAEVFAGENYEKSRRQAELQKLRAAA